MRRHLLEAFAKKLSKEDVVVIEATGNASSVAAVIAPHVKKVVIANPKQVRIIAHAKIKTDTIDAGFCAFLQSIPIHFNCCRGRLREGREAAQKALRKPRARIARCWWFNECSFAHCSCHGMPKTIRRNDRKGPAIVGWDTLGTQRNATKCFLSIWAFSAVLPRIDWCQPGENSPQTISANTPFR
jgi:hypothetical protein